MGGGGGIKQDEGGGNKARDGDGGGGGFSKSDGDREKLSLNREGNINKTESGEYKRHRLSEKK